MRNLNKFSLIILSVMLVIFLSFGLNFGSYASSSYNLNTSDATVQASQDNTSTIVQSVDEEDTSTAGLSTSDVINILLIAVGFVIILFAVAILIRLKNK